MWNIRDGKECGWPHHSLPVKRLHDQGAYKSKNVTGDLHTVSEGKAMTIISGSMTVAGQAGRQAGGWAGRQAGRQVGGREPEIGPSIGF